MIYLIIMLIFFSIIFFYFFYHKEPSITYLSKNKLIEYLIEDNDKFYDKFYEIDFKVRNIKNKEDYYKKINESIDDIDLTYKNLLNISINKSNQFFLNLKEPYFDNIKCYNIPWKIGTMKGIKYENGLPHTRGDIIILPKYTNDKDDFLTKLLIHEKIHIYQRFYPNLSEKFIKYHGFKKYKKVEDTDKIRANPDIDDWIYIDLDGKIYKSMFRENAKKITDVRFFPINKSRYEHPFEKMANEISDSYSIKKLI
jgi:hypothetical protein